MSLEQEGYRWRVDDGSETTASWLENQDTPATFALDTPTRLRILVNATGDPANAKYRLEYKKSTDSQWIGVPVEGTSGHAITLATSANITASGDNTTAQLTAPATKTTGDFDAGRMWDDENGVDAIDITTDNYTELEWCVQAVTGVAVATDVYQFRVTMQAAGGGSFAFAQDNASGALGSLGTIATSLTGVLSTDLIAIWVSWLHATATASVSDGSNTAQAATKHIDPNIDNVQWHYFLPSDTKNTGSVTYTATFTVNSTNRAIMVFRFSTTGTVAFDQQNADDGSGTSPVSGNITPTADVSVVLAGVSDVGLGNAPSAMQINGQSGTANTAGPVSNSTNSWFTIVSASFTGQATATTDDTDWVCNIVNFKAT